MATQLSALDAIPAEIIKRIASFAPCEAVINLLKVNRRLHRICSDTFVFKAILENGNMKPCAWHTGDSFLPPMDVSLLPGKSLSDWKRLALADTRARDWFHSRGMNGTNYDDMKEWLPQMLALDHPLIAKQLEINHLVPLLKQGLLGSQEHNHHNHLDGYMIETLAFFAMVTILKQTSEINHESNLNSYGHEYSVERSISQALGELRQLNTSGFLSPMASFYLPSVFACALVLDCETKAVNILPPSPGKMPLWTLMGLPMPFSAVHSLDDGFLKTMTSTSFLQDGEWVGYYSTGLVLGERVRFDPPMQGIRFRAIPEASHIFPDHVELQADGLDNVGRFSLSGFVQEDGTASFIKTYAAGFSWEWDAQMTPFGIIGAWGRNSREFGNFWIWKKEWSHVRCT
jgi:hypothetical protein